MEITLRDRKEVWRDRGRPRPEIPDEVWEIIDQTYKTGKVGELPTLTDEEAEEAREIIKTLRAAANKRGLHLKTQPSKEGDAMLFEVVDKPTTQKDR